MASLVAQSVKNTPAKDEQLKLYSKWGPWGQVRSPLQEDMIAVRDPQPLLGVLGQISILGIGFLMKSDSGLFIR